MDKHGNINKQFEQTNKQTYKERSHEEKGQTNKQTKKQTKHGEEGQKTIK